MNPNKPSPNSHLLDAVCRRGVLVATSVRYCCGCKKLNPEDLGLDPAHVSDLLIQLDHKRLIPRDAFIPDRRSWFGNTIQTSISRSMPPASPARTSPRPSIITSTTNPGRATRPSAGRDHTQVGVRGMDGGEDLPTFLSLLPTGETRGHHRHSQAFVRTPKFRWMSFPIYCNTSAFPFMKKNTISPDELDLFQLAEARRELDQRRKALELSQRMVEVERSDQENTLPPSDMINAKQKQKIHEEMVSRNEVRNIQREQRKYLLILALLIFMTATLIWWGIKLTQGG